MVTLIVAMLVAVVVPRVARTPRRMTVEQTLTTLRQALVNAASRARAGGQVQFVLLHPGPDRGGKLEITLGTAENMTHEWRPSRPSAAARPNAVLDSLSEYDLPAAVAWQDIDDKLDEDGVCRFVFYPDGQAAGPVLSFTVGGESFTLSVDPVTGRPLIENAQ